MGERAVILWGSGGFLPGLVSGEVVNTFLGWPKLNWKRRFDQFRLARFSVKIFFNQKPVLSFGYLHPMPTPQNIIKDTIARNFWCFLIIIWCQF